MKWLRYWYAALVAVPALVTWDYVEALNQRDELMALCQRQKADYGRLDKLCKERESQNGLVFREVARLTYELDRREGMKSRGKPVMPGNKLKMPRVDEE